MVDVRVRMQGKVLIQTETAATTEEARERGQDEESKEATTRTKGVNSEGDIKKRQEENNEDAR